MTLYEMLKARLPTEEGFERRRYRDSEGIWTIGVGHNIEADPHYPYTLADEPLSDLQINQLLELDIILAVAVLDQQVNWWRAMELPRQMVLADMCFNMGWGKLRGFVQTLQAMHFGDYTSAAVGMRQSLWASQVKGRAEALADIMEKGA